MKTIIVEGADCSGKDTLIESLSQSIGFSVVRGSSFEISKKGKQAMYDIMIESIYSDSNIIMNRSHLSNLVYAPIFGYPMIELRTARELKQRIDEEDVLVVYLYADSNILTERMKNRGDDDVKPSELNKILEGYSRIFDGKNAPKNVVKFNTGLMSTEEIRDSVAQMFAF